MLGFSRSYEDDFTPPKKGQGKNKIKRRRNNTVFWPTVVIWNRLQEKTNVVCIQ